ncbi:MAG: A/G-specific adenine glycosylase [Desulfitobacteriaceae bacterium]
MKTQQPDNPLFSQQLLSWYETEKRDLPWRRTSDPYCIWVSEVMLQQTQVKTVLPYYAAFLGRFPNLEHLAQATLEDVLTVWRGLGYYTRARHLWEGARYVLSTWNGIIPENYVQLRQIPGVGEYTAGAIASIAFGQRVTAIDGNVKRVLARLLAWPHPVENALSHRVFLKQLEEWLPIVRPGDFNQALMELGATVCTPQNPQCANCPLILGCQAHAQGNFCFPLKRAKASPRLMTRLTFVLVKEGKLFLQLRPPNGLLADLWEFPGKEIELIQNQEHKDNGISFYTPMEWFSYYQQVVGNRIYDDEVKRQLETQMEVYGPVSHTFSHRRWHLYWVLIHLETPEPREKAYRTLAEQNHGYRVNVMKGWKPERWISVADLHHIPIPSAFQGIIERLPPQL